MTYLLDFLFEARNPTGRVEASPSLKNNNNRGVAKYRTKPPESNITYFNPLENKLDLDSKEYIEQLYIRCEAYGKIIELIDFKYDGWK